MHGSTGAKRPSGAVFWDRHKTIAISVCLCLAIFACYYQVFSNGFVCYDDTKYLFEDDHIRTGLSLANIRWALTATYDANWFPLTWLSHMADMSLYGPEAGGHHLTNLILHCANTVLLFRLLFRTTTLTWRSAAVAALFALHPLHVESVAWAAERKDVLSTLFFFLTLNVYTSYRQNKSTARYLAMLLLYCCGLAAKPMIVSLPLVMLLLDIWPLGKASGNGNKPAFATLLVEKIPFFLLAGASSVLTFIVQKSGGSVYDTTNSPFSENAAHAITNYLLYLVRTFWPIDLAVLYPYQEYLPTWQVAGSGLAILTLTAMALAMFRTRPYLTVGWLWYVITITPVVGFIRIGVHSIADRYTYIPLTGIFIAMVWLIADLAAPVRWRRYATSGLFVVIITGFGIATWRQSTYWRNSITLFERTLRATSNNWLAHNNLASELIKSGQNAAALWHLQQAVMLRKDYAKAYFNMGTAYRNLGDLPNTMLAYQQAIIHDPKYVRAYYHLSLLYQETGNIDLAYATCDRLAAIDPETGAILRKYLGTLELLRNKFVH